MTKQAHEISYGFTVDGELVLSLHDAPGNPFAMAFIPSEGAAALAETIVEHLMPDDEDTIGEVAGHA